MTTKIKETNGGSGNFDSIHISSSSRTRKASCIAERHDIADQKKWNQMMKTELYKKRSLNEHSVKLRIEKMELCHKQ